MPPDSRDFSEISTDHYDPPGVRPPTRRQHQLSWIDTRGPHLLTLEERAVVGSAANVDVVVSDSTVSRLHAEFDSRADGLWVRDRGSRNGTYVESVRIMSARVPDG